MQSTLFLTSSLQAGWQHARAQVDALQRADPLARVFMLLPNAATIRQARRVMGDGTGVHFLEFYGLAELVLQGAGSAVYQLRDATVRELVRHLLEAMHEQGELTTFAPMRDKPGFVQRLLEWLREMKSQGITPEQVRAHVRTAREQQLARLYERYQQFLLGEGGTPAVLSDAEGLLWLAADELEQAPLALSPDPAALLVLGFDQFSPLQIRLLRGMAARPTPIGVFLLWDESRAANSRALARLRPTRAILESALALPVQAVEGAEQPDAALRLLHERLFEGAGEPPVGAAPSVRLLAAPSREAEVRAALRAVKRLLLGGVPAHEVLILAPHPEAYAATFFAVAEEFGLPVERESQLGQNPAVAALLNALALSDAFPWRETFDALRSPYLLQPWLTEEQIDQLDLLTRQSPVLAGRAQWHKALRPLIPASDEWEESDLGPPLLVATMPPEALEAIEQGLERFFKHLTPPPRGTPQSYRQWVHDRFLAPPAEGGLGLLDACAHGPFAARDLQAMGLLLSAMEAITEAAELMGEGPKQGGWQAFHTALLAAAGALRLRERGRRRGAGLWGAGSGARARGRAPLRAGAGGRGASPPPPTGFARSRPWSGPPTRSPSCAATRTRRPRSGGRC